MRTAKLLIITSAYLLLSCNEAVKTEPLYDEEIEILMHTMLIESTLQDFSGLQRDSLATIYYNQLYDRFGISAAGLNQLRDRFSDSPSLWQRASDSVAVRLELGRTKLDSLLR